MPAAWLKGSSTQERGCCIAVPFFRVLLTSVGVTRGMIGKGSEGERQMRARAHAAGTEPKEDYSSCPVRGIEGEK